MDNIIFEDHLIVPTDVNSFLAENNDDFILEHDARDNYAAQLLGYGIENVVQEFRISDLVANIGLEFDGDKGNNNKNKIEFDDDKILKNGNDDKILIRNIEETIRIRY